jgi:hypothetical protein
MVQTELQHCASRNEMQIRRHRRCRDAMRPVNHLVRQHRAGPRIVSLASFALLTIGAGERLLESFQSKKPE